MRLARRKGSGGHRPDAGRTSYLGRLLVFAMPERNLSYQALSTGDTANQEGSGSQWRVGLTVSTALQPRCGCGPARAEPPLGAPGSATLPCSLGPRDASTRLGTAARQADATPRGTLPSGPGPGELIAGSALPTVVISGGRSGRGVTRPAPGHSPPPC